MSDTNERQLRIAHYPEENERAIFRETEGIREWLGYGDKRGKERDAKRYWHENDCISALIKIRKGNTTEGISQQDRKEEEKSEKKSWSEL